MLEDGDIALRPYTEDDVPAITAACQDTEIPPWTSVPSPYTEEDARRFVRGLENVYAFAVVDTATTSCPARSDSGSKRTDAPARRLTVRLTP
jgi:hypothetical protein